MIPPVSNSLQGLIKTHGRFIAKERTIMTKKIVLIVMTVLSFLIRCIMTVNLLKRNTKIILIK